MTNIKTSSKASVEAMITKTSVTPSHAKVSFAPSCVSFSDLTRFQLCKCAEQDRLTTHGSFTLNAVGALAAQAASSLHLVDANDQPYKYSSFQI